MDAWETHAKGFPVTAPIAVAESRLATAKDAETEAEALARCDNYATAQRALEFHLKALGSQGQP